MLGGIFAVLYFVNRVGWYSAVSLGYACLVMDTAGIGEHFLITLLCSIGILGMIAAKYTPIFDIAGYIFLPFTKLFAVPDAQVAASAIATGVTEMFIPVLTIADRVADLHIKTRFFVTVVSMVQIIFLAESVVVIMNTGLPIKFRELMIMFVQRTIIAIPFVAFFMHILF